MDMVERELWAIRARGRWYVAYRRQSTADASSDVWWTADYGTWICKVGDEDERRLLGRPDPAEMPSGRRTMVTDDELVKVVADAIRHAEVETKNGYRDLGYFACAGVDAMHHSHDTLDEVLLAAARAAVFAVREEQAPPRTDRRNPLLSPQSLEEDKRSAGGAPTS